MAWAVALLILIVFTLGLASRVTAVLAWVIMVSTSRRVPVLYFGFDQAILSWLLYLAVTGASGQALSLDRLLARRRQRRSVGGPPAPSPTPTVSANLALRLIQLNLCMIYAAAGLAKLQGRVWWTGDAVLMILLSPEYRVGDLTWLAAYPRFLNFLTHATVALEILYPVLVWVRRLRPIMVVAMILLHVGIDLTLGLTEFSLAMIAGNLAFVVGSWLRGRSRRVGRALSYAANEIHEPGSRASGSHPPIRARKCFDPLLAEDVLADLAGDGPRQLLDDLHVLGDLEVGDLPSRSRGAPRPSASRPAWRRPRPRRPRRTWRRAGRRRRPRRPPGGGAGTPRPRAGRCSRRRG